MEKSFEHKASFEVQTVARQKARRQKSAWGWVLAEPPFGERFLRAPPSRKACWVR